MLFFTCRSTNYAWESVGAFQLNKAITYGRRLITFPHIIDVVFEL